MNTLNASDVSEITFITKLFKNLILTTSVPGLEAKEQDIWRTSFITCVEEVAQAFILERPLLTAKHVDLEQWMKLRIVTISGMFIWLALLQAISNFLI